MQDLLGLELASLAVLPILATSASGGAGI